MKINGTGKPNTRHNINDFSTDKQYEIQWSLYVRALNIIKAAPITDPISFYSIAAIHGQPIRSWPELVDGGHLNWCSHGIPPFLTWHRVYLFLFEKCIVDQALKLVKEAPAEFKVEYTAEARKIRQPFWDWANNQDMPPAVTQATVKVIKIKASDEITVANPLFSYTFPVPPPVGSDSTISRYENSIIKKNLLNDQVRKAVYNALTKTQGFGAFSNTKFPIPVASIEQPHNSVHNAVGATMANPNVASFDPIFWLHHAAIDRYYALWQTMHPLSPWEENDVARNTVDQMLAPFERDAPFGSWSSRMVQYVDEKHIPSFFEFGVQYTEVLSTDEEFERQRKTRESIVRLYGPLSVPVSLPPTMPAPDGAESAPFTPPDLSHQYPPGAIPQFGLPSRKLVAGYPKTLPEEAALRREWKVIIEVKDDIVVGNFTVFVFLGEPGPVNEWGNNQTTAGAIRTFKATLETCRNCQEHQGESIFGTVYLTDALQNLLPDTATFDDLTPTTAYLNTELSFRVRKADGTEHPLTMGDGSFSAKVESYIEAYAPVDKDGIPLASDMKHIVGVTFGHEMHPDVTEGTPNYQSI